MESPTTQNERDMEVWREAWEKERAHLPPEMRRPFPDQSLFNAARHARKVTDLLWAHGIPCCVVGTKALCYFGAGRFTTTWELCVPTKQLADADAIFSTGPAQNDYIPWRGRHPEAEARLLGSLYHTFPRYRLNHDGPLFDFYLVPSNDWRFDRCMWPENFEYSAQRGVPYPELHLFAQALMERQSFNDLQDLVDGMDLTEEWGEQNLKFDINQDEYAKWVAEKNEKIRAALPQEVKDDPINVMFGTEMYEIPEGMPEFREVFSHAVRTKRDRIGPELPKELFATQYRAKGSPDPRTEVRFHV